MKTENTIRPANVTGRRYLPWLNLALTAILIIAGLWFLSTRIDPLSLLAALLDASMGWVALSVFIMLLTITLKAVRWQLMFPTETPPVRLTSSFWALTLGQYVNLVVPLLRLGEVARLYALNQEQGTSPGRALGTLVVEKTLDLIFFGMTIILVIPFIILPDYVNNPGISLVLLPLSFLSALYLLAYQTEFVIRFWRRLVSPLPQRPKSFLLRLAVAGLEGLAALRNRRLSLMMLLLSAAVAFLSIALPYTLFPALNIPLDFLDAVLVHIVVTIAIVPPTTPAKIGVLNGAAALALWQLGMTDETQIAGYSILLYMVVVIPQIILGLIAASRTKWRWQQTIPATPNTVGIDNGN